MESNSRSNQQSLHQRIVTALFTLIDAASLAYFRIVFYAIMVWESCSLTKLNWVGLYYSDKEFYFTYWPFDFIHPWPAEWMTIHIYAMGLVAACALCGLFYRLSATLFFFLWTYLFLLEKALYINHLYLVCLLSFLMIFIPANHIFSLDVLRQSEKRSDTVPAWTLWLLRFQIGVSYFFGGLAKINADWLQGEPLRTWLAERVTIPVIGPLFNHESVVWGMTYGSLIFDVTVVPFLLNRRTRVFGYIVALFFHFMNARLFGIGIFAWMMIAATLIFFEPDWPRRVLQDVQRGSSRRVQRLTSGGLLGLLSGAITWQFSWVRACLGALGVGVLAYHLDEPFRQASRPHAQPSLSLHLTGLQRGLLAFLGIWVVIQLLLPFRHFVIPGNVHWTEEGHNFAWHMMLRQKEAEGFFVVTDPATGKEWDLNPRQYLTRVQLTQMLSRPHMIVQFAHYLGQRLQADGCGDVEIHARITAALNGREAQYLIDPAIDLIQVAYPWWGHAEWIMPLETPLRR